jgi:hypothetical protein
LCSPKACIHRRSREEPLVMVPATVLAGLWGVSVAWHQGKLEAGAVGHSVNGIGQAAEG